jgi:heterodisulfide reductase subunit A
MPAKAKAHRIGLFVCHCGLNIAGTVDIPQVLDAFRDEPGVLVSVDYKYMCSEPGQELIRRKIAEEKLDGVVVAACSPTMHEATFRRNAESAGLNPYRVEIANIREQVSWVHAKDPDAATRKAIEVIRTIIEKVRYDEELLPFTLPVVRRALVIGGGIAGIQAALDIAAAGFPVLLVEREARLGGRMAQLSGTYFNFESAGDLLAQKLEALRARPEITVLTESEVESLNGYVGNFTVRIRRRGEDQPREESVGAIVVATGFDLYPLERLPEYGAGAVPDVISGLEMEAMLRPDGPTGGRILRPSDGRPPREVVFVQCAGSRDPEHAMPYCSKICCMYTAKQARLFRRQCPDGQAYVFYIDIRSGGKGAEEFVQAAMEEERVLYLRGKVSRIFRDGDKVMVWGADTLSGQQVEIAADLVVLATAVVPRQDARELAQRLRVGTDQHGFFNEAHPKLRPVESLTAGIYLAGAAQGPKDIPETLSQAGAAAAKVLSLFSRHELVQEPTIAWVDPELCSACQLCVPACPYEARRPHPWKPVVTVNAALCQGCGACAMVCPNKASKLRNYTPEQVLAMVDVLFAPAKAQEGT